MKKIYSLIVLLLIINFACTTKNKKNIAQHVVVIGVDGLSVNGVKTANTPYLDSLMANGASTLNSRGVIPTSSGPNWASILMGAGPEKHGVKNNSFNPLEPALPPVVSGKGKKGLFPGVYEILKTQKPNWETGAVYHWPTIRNYFQEEHISHFENHENDKKVTEKAKEYLTKSKPKFCFVHLDDVDHAGHSYGHGSKAYFKAVEKTDSLIGDICKSLKTSGLYKNTLIIITADHGGLGFGHNESVPEVLGVPFIVSGPSVKKGYKITEPVSTVNTSPTVLYALGLNQPSVWTGKPVKTAFVGNNPDTTYLKRVFYRKPRFIPMQDEYIPAGGLYLNKKPIFSIDNQSADDAQIRYTLNGEDPTIQSKLYANDTIVFNETTVVKAAKFKDNKRVSNVNTAFYRVAKKQENNGVNADIYYGKNLDKLPDFNSIKPVLSNFKMYEFTSRGLVYPKGADQIAVKFTSYIDVAIEGEYTFYLESDDGSKLLVNDKLVVDHDGNHGVRPKDGKIHLTKGKHKINVLWYNSGGGLWLQTYIKAPNSYRQVLTSNMPLIKANLYLQ